jgi:hypothetical protein
MFRTHGAAVSAKVSRTGLPKTNPAIMWHAPMFHVTHLEHVAAVRNRPSFRPHARDNHDLEVGFQMTSPAVARVLNGGTRR